MMSQPHMERHFYIARQHHSEVQKSGISRYLRYHLVQGKHFTFLRICVVFCDYRQPKHPKMFALWIQFVLQCLLILTHSNIWPKFLHIFWPTCYLFIWSRKWERVEENIRFSGNILYFQTRNQQLSTSNYQLATSNQHLATSNQQLATSN